MKVLNFWTQDTRFVQKNVQAWDALSWRHLRQRDMKAQEKNGRERLDQSNRRNMQEIVAFRVDPLTESMSAASLYFSKRTKCTTFLRGLGNCGQVAARYRFPSIGAVHGSLPSNEVLLRSQSSDDKDHNKVLERRERCRSFLRILERNCLPGNFVSLNFEQFHHRISTFTYTLFWHPVLEHSEPHNDRDAQT
jgi:hypothetical protein